jgi:hypothetical protein
MLSTKGGCELYISALSKILLYILCKLSNVTKSLVINFTVTVNQIDEFTCYRYFLVCKYSKKYYILPELIKRKKLS